MTDKKKKFSQLVYAAREQHFAQEWAKIKDTPDKGGHRNYQDFKQTAAISKQIYQAYKTGGHYYTALKRDFDAVFSDNTEPTESDTSIIEKTNYRDNPASSTDVDQENIHQESGSGRGPNTGARSGATATGSGNSPASGVTLIRPKPKG